ncbi:hypothetical protein AB4Z22_01480 [Paenibacillus sp. TAF58]
MTVLVAKDTNRTITEGGTARGPRVYTSVLPCPVIAASTGVA